MGPPKVTQRKSSRAKQDSVKPTATRMRPTEGACFCITRSLRCAGSWWAHRPQELAEPGDRRRERAGGQDRLHGVAGRDEVDVAVGAVGILRGERAVADVPQPAEPVEVALVAPGRPG